jgi:hypothetical protein
MASINTYDKVRPKKIGTGYAHAWTKDGAAQERDPTNRGEVDIRSFDDKSSANRKRSVVRYRAT